ncbi:GroES-like protein [Aspergillus ambiguus]|uniref:GroES-like protein n=1 Tax=Aspergillus ambiguus TaxID=176160 RepID=UPI003CCD80A7
MSDTMNAIVITKFGGPDVLEHRMVPRPTIRTGEVLVGVKAFGLNHAEMHMRKGEWDEWNPVTGLECVGIVEACPGGEFNVGETVVGVMGGLGRNRPGGYGEFAAVPATNVIAVQTNLSWDQLAAIPETYITAWSCLFTVLALRPGEDLLIRGATSTLGQAAVKLAVNAGARVTATTRRRERFEFLRKMGAAETIIEQSGLNRIHTTEFDKVLNLIGNRVLLESLNLTKSGGRMLQAGWLGGLDPVKDFNPMLQMKSGVHFSLFHGKVLGSPGFPFSKIPLQRIVQQIENGEWDARPTHIFNYKDIRKAHEILDSGDAEGKIVVKRF